MTIDFAQFGLRRPNGPPSGSVIASDSPDLPGRAWRCIRMGIHLLVQNVRLPRPNGLAMTTAGVEITTLFRIFRFVQGSGGRRR
jgi:hypothetical protein